MLNKTKKESIIAYSVGICYASVCVKIGISKSEIEKRMNMMHPTGITSKWKISKDNFRTGASNPCPCHDDPTRQHYLLNC